MCLEVDKRRTRELKQKLSKTGSIVCYKSINCYNGKVRSLFYSHHTWLPEWNISNRDKIELTYEEIVDGYISHGIHVYTSYRAASSQYNKRDIIPVRCYKKDLVSGGKEGEAVFMKVFLRKRDYHKALKTL